MFRSKSDLTRADFVKPLYSEKKLNGVKYDQFSSRTGLASVLDKGLRDRQIANEELMYGKGFIQYQMIGDGNKDTPMNIDGRLFYGDKDGIFTIIDSDLVEKEHERELQKRKYLEDIIEKASMSDEICALILAQPDVAALKANFLGSGADAGGEITDPDLKAVNAMPSAIESYDPSGSSITFSRAIQKFKIVCKLRMPIMQSMTNKKVQNEA